MNVNIGDVIGDVTQPKEINQSRKIFLKEIY